MTTGNFAMNSLFKIKNFGNDVPLNSIEDLKNKLADDFKGQSVSFVYTCKTSQILKVVYVTIDAAGTILHSYGDKQPVNFNSIAY